MFVLISLLVNVRTLVQIIDNSDLVKVHRVDNVPVGLVMSPEGNPLPRRPEFEPSAGRPSLLPGAGGHVLCGRGGMADAPDLGSGAPVAYGFKSLRPHHFKWNVR